MMTQMEGGGGEGGGCSRESRVGGVPGNQAFLPVMIFFFFFTVTITAIFYMFSFLSFFF